jgi:hypothetical protein
MSPACGELTTPISWSYDESVELNTHFNRTCASVDRNASEYFLSHHSSKIDEATEVIIFMMEKP